MYGMIGISNFCGAQPNNAMNPTPSQQAFWIQRIVGAGYGGRYVLSVNVSMQLQNIIATIENIKSAEDAEELRRLDSAVVELFQSEHPEYGLQSLLGVFERFPDKDGYGVFWGTLHGIESIVGYEHALIESVKRQPSEFSLLMINRLLNAGRLNVSDADLMSLLEEIANGTNNAESIREDAKKYLAYQRGRT